MKLPKPGKTFFHWLRVGAEYVAWLLLIFKFIPEKFVSNWRENGLAATILLGLALLFVLFSRYVFEKKVTNELEQKNNVINERDEEAKQLKKLAKYSDVFPLLNEAFSRLHDTIRGNPEQEKFMQAFKDFCTKLSHLFHQVTGEEYHVCIKIPVKTRNNTSKMKKLKAMTLARDALSIKRDNVDTGQIEHIFEQNTDFAYILENMKSDKGRYFISNNLPSIPNYKNTSFLAKGDSITYFPESVSVEEKEKNWPLPYKSSIASPICPGINKQREAGTLVGFLCVDSPKQFAFNENIDPEIVFGCADGLYNPLKLYLETYLLPKKQANEVKKSSGREVER